MLIHRTTCVLHARRISSANYLGDLQMHADALQLPVRLPAEDEAVLLGAAVLGATAGKAHPSVRAAAAAMTSVGASVAPDGREDVVEYHRRKYGVFRKMNDDQVAYRQMMTE